MGEIVVGKFPMIGTRRLGVFENGTVAEVIVGKRAAPFLFRSNRRPNVVLLKLVVG